ncbi:MAG: helix-turn-helix transcriptional regulator [Deltaproteobacteria bacterium]|nr:helix-turn-helix transcriptional regulator [Deltaproteobacteria bacterium]
MRGTIRSSATRYRAWVDHLATTRSSRALCTEVAETLPALFDVAAAAVTLWPPGGLPTDPRSCFAKGGPPWLVSAAFEFGASNDPISRAVYSEHVAVHDGSLMDLEAWKRHAIFDALARPSGLHWYMVSPVLASGRILGVLLSLRPPQAPRFTDRDLACAQAAAAHVAPLLASQEAARDRRRRSRPRGTPFAPIALLDRHAELVELVARGHTNVDIAKALGKSPHTVRHQLEMLFERLEVSTRSELTALWATHTTGRPHS